MSAELPVIPVAPLLSPFVATTALIGGGLANAFMKDDKEVNYRFSKVSDADMVLLVRKIDELQKTIDELRGKQ